MTRRLHSIFTPDGPSIYDELIDLIDRAELAEEAGHPADAMVLLTTAKTRLVAYLSEKAN